MKIENIYTFNIGNAFRGMRNPLESWDRSDSIYSTDETFYLGEKDKELAQRLIKAGNEHRKFMRQIIVSLDLTAPLYFWKEFDTYKVGTTANSTSTMHKLASTPITEECFELENLDVVIDDDNCFYDYFEKTMIMCEVLRNKYNETKDKRYWKALIQMLPESWLQTRTLTLSYENILNMIHQRENHRLSEWQYVINEFKKLPYAKELLFLNEE